MLISTIFLTFFIKIIVKIPQIWYYIYDFIIFGRRRHMNSFIDTHTHTIASGHYTTDTVRNLAEEASKKGLEYLGVTDHSFGVLTGAKESYFLNLKLLSPKNIYGVKMLYGAEVNILGTNGKIDLSDETMAKLDYCIASLHSDCYKPSTEKDNTLALTNAMKNKFVNIIGHAENSEYPADFSLVAECASDTGTMIELNGSSVMNGGYRGNQRPYAKKLLTECKKQKTYISLGSDSHGRERVGYFKDCLELLGEVSYPEDLIVNFNRELFFKLISEKRKLWSKL